MDLLFILALILLFCGFFAPIATLFLSKIFKKHETNFAYFLKKY
jgi:hypothetical protein